MSWPWIVFRFPYTFLELIKLEFYGIDGKFKTLIESYLKGRYRKVILGNVTDSSKSSIWEEIKNGVLQGSILGPPFFFYINDLPKIINNGTNMVLFVDDTSILVTDSNKMDFNINIKKHFWI